MVPVCPGVWEVRLIGVLAASPYRAARVVASMVHFAFTEGDTEWGDHLTDDEYLPHESDNLTDELMS